MRWFLAATSFALLLSLAVTTAAVRATNLDVRLRLQKIEFGLITHQMEVAWREREMQRVTEPNLLRRQWQQLSHDASERAAARLQ